MKKIFIGLLFMFLKLNFFGVNLMPNFVGYSLICAGLNEEYECPSLNASRTITVAAAIPMAVVWLAGLFGYGMTFPIGTILDLLVTYRLVLWAEEQGEAQGWSGVETRRFRVSWYAMAGTVAATTVLRRVSTFMALPWAVVGTAAIVYYIYNYYKLWHSAAPMK